MSLSLVADYGSSDSEDDTVQSPPKNPAPNVPQTTSTRPSLFSALPAPKQKSVTSSSSSSQPTQPKKLQIFVDLPSAKPTADDDDDDAAQPEKRRRTDGGGGLFAMLPPPKAVSAPSKVSKEADVKPATAKPVGGMIPYSLTKKKAPAPTNDSKPTTAAATAVNPEKPEEDYGGEDFFTLDVGETSYDALSTIPPPTSYSNPAGPAPAPAPAPSDYSYAYPQYQPHDSTAYAYAPHPGLSASSSYSAAYAYPQQPSSEATGEAPYAEDLDNDALKALGIRKKDGPIQFKDVSQSEMLNDGTYQYEQARLASMDHQPSMPNKFGAVGGALKRKHNIKSLAFEARVRQQQLQEATAQRIANQRVTRAKYGF
ncbi:hypothetical protein HDV00_001521 [Rhizophlyctis rosea]|nr:hypothetical protein HDV00_001521 [Rhizophlyctis rosea]